MAKENVFKGVDWSEAPEWANYWTCDQDGSVWWERAPDFYHRQAIWVPGAVGRIRRARSFNFSSSGVLPSSSLVNRLDEKAIDQSSQAGGFSDDDTYREWNPSNHEDNLV